MRETTQLPKPSLHIAALAFPFGTHAAPLLSLLRKIAASAPHHTTAISFFSTETSNRALFPSEKTEEFGNIKPYDIPDGVPESAGPGPAAIGYFMKSAPENFERKMREAEEENGVKFSCLVTDAFLWFGCDLAEKLGIPWVPFWTAAACSLSVHYYTDEIRKIFVAGTDGGEDHEQTLKSIPGLSSVKPQDLPSEVLVETPLAATLHKMGLKLPKAAAVVINSFEEFEPTITNDLQSKLQKVVNIGPLNLISSAQPSSAEDDECLLWLKKHKEGSVVYISFGTVATLPPNEIMALVEALEFMRVPFLWSMRDEAKKLLPQGFVEKTSDFGKIVSWAPQVQVLGHSSVGVFVTHCGWNSILEGLSSGVPLIARPFFGDQSLNSRMIEDVWKIGLRMEGGVFTKNGAINALKLILSTNRGREIKENVKRAKEKALDAVKSNGSSSRNFKLLLESLAS